MVHSDLIFSHNKLCKRRRFLSDLNIPLFLSKAQEKPFWPFWQNQGALAYPR